MPNRARGFNRNVKASLALFCAATACAIVIAAGGCGDDNLVFPGGKTPAVTGTVATQTVGTATPTPQGTSSPTGTPRAGVTPPSCATIGQSCSLLKPCCSGASQCLPPPVLGLPVSICAS